MTQPSKSEDDLQESGTDEDGTGIHELPGVLIEPVTVYNLVASCKKADSGKDWVKFPNFPWPGASTTCSRGERVCSSRGSCGGSRLLSPTPLISIPTSP